jgi:phenylpropionate dioxygenase-like ring-hydroxylating dioxygenase large terminal subunit
MLVTKQPVLRRFWYPVMPVSHLAGGPKPFTLLGENIVLWRAEDGSIACLKDRCRHRTAKLSAGWLQDGNIVCGYHGWTYGPDGACKHIPQSVEDARMAERVRVDAYRATEKYGYVWVALDAPLVDIPQLPEAMQEGFRQVDQFYETWDIGALRLMENSFDSAHIAFVHRNTFGNVARPETVKRELTPRQWGFDSLAIQPVQVRGDLAHRAVHNGSNETVRRTESTWYMPFVRRAAIHYPEGLVHVLVTCATPMRDDKTMVLQWVYRNDRESDVSSADVIGFDRAITFEDKAILETCDADVPLALADGEEMHMGSDRPGLLMRRMFAQLLHEHGESEIRASAG